MRLNKWQRAVNPDRILVRQVGRKHIQFSTLLAEAQGYFPALLYHAFQQNPSRPSQPQR
jgi:hypothetical protein